MRRLRRIAVVTNPIAGSSARARALAAFAEALRRGGCDAAVLETERRGHAPELARRAAEEGAAAVVAAGGDGTVNEVASGLLELGAAAPPLGILPRGTSNLVARELRIPFDPARAAGVVLGGAPRTIDVARMGGRLLVACGGVGWDAHVVRTLTEARRGHITLTTWLRPIASALRDYRFPEFRVRWDGGDGGAPCVLALFLNCRPYARFFAPAPDARPDDGLLDAVLVAPGARARMPRIAWRAWRGTLRDDPAVAVVRAARFRVDAGDAVPWQVDGDVGGQGSVDLAVVPAALRVLAPPAPGAAPSPRGASSGGVPRSPAGA